MRSRWILAVVLITVLVGLVALWQGFGSVRTDHEQATFADLDDYFASREWATSDKDRVVFIGIDGGSWRFIDPLISRGVLPNFARLKNEGGYGTLQSVPCFFSPPAWTTMLTGYLPHKTGIYTFGKWDSGTQEFVNVNSEDVAVPSVWDVASYGGQRTAVINVPMTYPTNALNGVAVSGLMTPIESSELASPYRSIREHQKDIPVNEAVQSYSPIFLEAFDDSLNSFRWSLYDTVDDGKRAYDKVHLSVFPKHGESTKSRPISTATFNTGQYSPWLRVHAVRNGTVEDAWCKLRIVESGGRYRPDVSRLFFEIRAPYCYPDSLDLQLRETFGYYLPTKFLTGRMVPEMTAEAARYAEHFYEYDNWDLYLYVFTQSDNIHHTLGFSQHAVEVYKTIDRFIGTVMDRMDTNTTLIVASDHGFAEYSYGIDLNQYFEEAGLLVRSDDGAIDHDRTLVFHNLWHLYFNHDLLTHEHLGTRGIEIASGTNPVEALRKHMQGLVRGLTSPAGRSIEISFEPVPEGVGERPDMVVRGANGECFVEFWNLRKPQATPFFELSGGARFEHARDGIFAAWGNGIVKGADAGVLRIQDVAPTILLMLDLPIAGDMDGEIIDAIFTPAYRTENAPRTVANYALIQSADHGGVDRESLEKKLRSLGYIR